MNLFPTSSATVLLLCSMLIIKSAKSQEMENKRFKIIQLTHNAGGHTLHNTQCFSPNDQWIVFDTRNDDTAIGSTGSIAMVNSSTGEIRPLYHTQHQTIYGPGVGAATFSPVANRVLFIHGIRNANERDPYGITRRTGVAIDIANPFHPIFMDARDVIPPFTKGALRGGTHAHTWSGDGQWISYTYNDYIMEQRSKTDTMVKDMRTVGVMVPGHAVHVSVDSTEENNSGEMFSVVVAKVIENPVPGSVQIDKAFDEGWIGQKGYQKSDGTWQHRAIAFQGEVKDKNGNNKIEVFVLDLPDDLTKVNPGEPLEGSLTTRPNVPTGVVQKRITHTRDGIQGPRHWLRSTPDGKLISFLAKDRNGIVQIYAVSPNGGEIRPLTDNDYSVQGTFNFSPDGKEVAYLADNRVYITDLQTGKSSQLTPRYADEEKPVGGPVWSNGGDMLAFNRYGHTNREDRPYLQIFLLKRHGQ